MLFLRHTPAPAPGPAICWLDAAAVSRKNRLPVPLPSLDKRRPATESRFDLAHHSFGGALMSDRAPARANRSSANEQHASLEHVALLLGFATILVLAAVLAGGTAGCAVGVLLRGVCRLPQGWSIALGAAAGFGVSNLVFFIGLAQGVRLADAASKVSRDGEPTLCSCCHTWLAHGQVQCPHCEADLRPWLVKLEPNQYRSALALIVLGGAPLLVFAFAMAAAIAIIGCGWSQPAGCWAGGISAGFVVLWLATRAAELSRWEAIAATEPPANPIQHPPPDEPRPTA